MIQKPFVVLAILLIMAGLIAECLQFFGFIQSNSLVSALSGLGRLLGIILILLSGRLIHRKLLFNVIVLFACIAAVGVLFKITHAPYANFLFTTGLTSLAFTYTLHFITKGQKGFLDIVKLMWLLAFCAAAILMLQHWHYGRELKILESIVFIILFSVFACHSFARNTLPQQKL